MPGLIQSITLDLGFLTVEHETSSSFPTENTLASLLILGQGTLLRRSETRPPGLAAVVRHSADGSRSELQPGTAAFPLQSVLADEAPRLPHTPIASDHPVTPQPPQIPQYPSSSTTLYLSNNLANTGPSSLNQIATQPGSNLSSLRAVYNPELPNPRRRRRSPSPGPLQTEDSAGGHSSSNTVTEEETYTDRATNPSRPIAERSPARKRPRLTTRDMRYDPDPSTSNGSQHVPNGSQHLLRQKSAISNGANGHTATNGHTSPHRNELPSSTARASPNTFYGHDREEVTRLLIQGLDDLGYHAAADKLSQESGYEVESSAVAQFREAVLQGDWEQAEALLLGSEPPDGGGGVSIRNGDYRGLKLIEGANRDHLRFLVKTQKYLELLESEDLGRALLVLRQELRPLEQDRVPELQHLSSMLGNMPDAVKSAARWDGAKGQSRQLLLQELSRSISPSVMIPQHRLAVLLNQVKQNQISHCLYHNPSSSPSLFADHMCDRSQFPLRTILELNQSAGEVWAMEFSHDGRRLAASGQATDVLIYDTSMFQVLYRLTNHTDRVAYLAWSPDDSKIITCSHDKTARVWDAPSGQEILKIDHHENPVTAAAWSPDGQSFVTGSLHGNHRLCLWSMNGHPIYNWLGNYRVQDCAISPNGKRMVVISSECQIVVYDFGTREELYCILVKSQMTCVKISRDSRHMLVNMANSEVHLIDIDTAGIVRRFLGQQQGEFVIRSTFGGADQNLVISGSEDSRIYIWHKENGTLIETLEGHQTPGCVTVVAWNPADPCMFASGGDDRKIRIWSKEDSDFLAKRRRRLEGKPSKSSPNRGGNGP
ncbi:MAG: hypothetical protein Q9225_006852, partial [Loekoesia sp. 1 TL-2023]